jgi:hypothetical protein
VTAVAELEEPDDLPEPELEEPDDLPEPELEEPDEPDDLLEPDEVLLLVEVDFAAADFASAGSLPVASCTRIPPELARNNATAKATTRPRIILIRRLRSRSRSATSRFAPDPPAGRGRA